MTPELSPDDKVLMEVAVKQETRDDEARVIKRHRSQIVMLVLLMFYGIAAAAFDLYPATVIMIISLTVQAITANVFAGCWKDDAIKAVNAGLDMVKTIVDVMQKKSPKEPWQGE